MLALLIAAAAVTPSPPTVADARASLLGRWHGKLEYRDYQADKWFGLPVAVEVRDGGDGVTLIRTADYDDGPKAGNVRITTVAMLAADGAHESSATFRKGRAVELQTAALALRNARDPQHWTLIETITGTDADRPAVLRLTTTHDGASLVTLKEVDFTDDAETKFLPRNRTTLTLLP
jgi:hypothetical protein